MTRPASLGLGESSRAVSAKEIRGNVYRGAMWELARIGHPWPAIAQGVLLVLLVVFAITGMPWPSIIASGALMGVAIWSQRNVVRWAEAHNARVAPAKVPPLKSKPQAAPRPARATKSKRRA